MRRITATESQIQRAAFQEIHRRAQFDWRWQLIYAVPNGMHIAGSKLDRIKKMNRYKAEGLLTGVWDISIDVAVSPFPGCKIEVKTPRNELTPEQARMGELYKKAGYALFIARTSEQIIKICEMYLSGKIRPNNNAH